MGLERISTVLQGVHSVFETNTFRAIINASAELTRTASDSASHKVIADHLRSASFLIADGVLPGNEGRSYVVTPHHAPRHAPRPPAGAPASRSCTAWSANSSPRWAAPIPTSSVPSR
jgi:alanyl-tRNA synthetase